jgi:hypothetical protein
MREIRQSGSEGGGALTYLAHLDENPIDFPGVPAAERANSSGFRVVEDHLRRCSEDLTS